jgi:hypothetical protein
MQYILSLSMQLLRCILSLSQDLLSTPSYKLWRCRTSWACRRTRWCAHDVCGCHSLRTWLRVYTKDYTKRRVTSLRRVVRNVLLQVGWEKGAVRQVCLTARRWSYWTCTRVRFPSFCLR